MNYASIANTCIQEVMDKSFEIGFKKHMLFIKQYELFQKNTQNRGGGGGGGGNVKFSLFYVAWESWQTAHYLFTVCTCT